LCLFAFLALLSTLCFPAFAGNFQSDVAIVRAILDSNGVSAPLSSVAARKNGRIVALHFNEPYRQQMYRNHGFVTGVRVSKIPRIINGLDALDTLEISYATIGAKLSLPSFFGGLSGLRSLSIRGAALGSVPDGFSELDGLRTLTLAGDSITSFPEAITGLHGLVEVNLSDNRIRSIPKSIGSMQSLRSLNIRNQMTDTAFSIAPELACDSLLSILDLSLNDLSVFPTTVLRLKHLSELHMENCRLSALPSEIGSLRELAYLNAGWNGFTGLPAGLGNLKSLKTLILISNPLDSLPSVICDLTGLSYLDLQECRLTSLPSAIGALSSLQELNVCYNRISQLPQEIGNLKNVTTLRLQKNNLSSLPESITQLTPRNWLSLRNNPLFDPSMVDSRISAWLCRYDVNWGTDFSVCDDRTNVAVTCRDTKRLPIFTASQGTVHYTLFSPAQVSLKLYDMQGRLLKVLCNQSQPGGKYDVGIPAIFSGRMCILALKVDGAEFTKALSSVR
jgi:Leucine-rich repeat (LRR) protein